MEPRAGMRRQPASIAEREAARYLDPNDDHSGGIRRCIEHALAAERRRIRKAIAADRKYMEQLRDRHAETAKQDPSAEYSRIHCNGVAEGLRRALSAVRPARRGK